MTNNDYDYLYKVILIGDASVGKSNILNRFIRNEFNIDSKSTIGVEFATKTIIHNKQRIKIQLWDTAGQERFRAVTSAYYRGAQGIVLVFDVTNRVSFEHVDKWLREIKDNGDTTSSVILVGNKIDLAQNRVISTGECIEFASKAGVYYIETSAKQGLGIDDMFMTLATEIYRKKRLVSENDDAPGRPLKGGTVKVVVQSPKNPVNPSGKKCC